MKKENKIAFRLYATQALFSDPITRVGGEKCTYSVPTYEALKGICESIYWKPVFIWVIDRVRVLNQIKTESKGIRVPKYYGGNDLSIYTYLRDVAYEVEAHFEWNENRPELENDRNENKHYYIAKRMLERGGRRDIFLGTRECQGYVEPCSFGSSQSWYEDKNILNLGIMLHGINYPDMTGKDFMEIRLWDVKMRNGMIDFIRPEECSIVMRSSKASKKIFAYGENYSGLKEFEKEGVFIGMDE